MVLVILIPAAGASTRMRGRDKLLEKIDDVPLLAQQTGRALELEVPVLVTLPNDAHDARKLALAPLANPYLTLKAIPDAAEGLSGSIRHGVAWARSKAAQAVMVLLPDLPDVTATDLRTLQAAQKANSDAILRATSATGVPGHPTILPARLFDQLSMLRGDAGAKDLLQSEGYLPCPLPDSHATTDLDTPEAWEKWRAERGA